MTWTQSGEHAYVSGAKAISRVFDDGCTMYRYNDGTTYRKHSEDIADALVSASFPDRAAMREFINHRGLIEWAMRGKSVTISVDGVKQKVDWRGYVKFSVHPRSIEVWNEMESA